MRSFSSKEEFLQWREKNRGGFVLNQLAQTRFRLHIARCNTLRDIGPEALANPKHCSTDLSVLQDFATNKTVVKCETCREHLTSWGPRG